MTNIQEIKNMTTILNKHSGIISVIEKVIPVIIDNNNTFFNITPKKYFLNDKVGWHRLASQEKNVSPNKTAKQL